MPATQTKPVQKRPTAPRRRTKKGRPEHSDIARRAYFIHLEGGGSDQLQNWLRAERELRAA